jgi:hypothetical protein
MENLKMKTISLTIFLAVSALLSLAPLHAMEKEVSIREIKPLTEIIFDYLIKLYDTSSAANKTVDPQHLIQIFYNAEGHFARIPAEITQKFLAYAQEHYPHLFSLVLPPKILLSDKKFFSQDETTFFTVTNRHTISLYHNEPGDKRFTRITFDNNVQIVEIKPAQGPTNNQENNFYILVAVYESDPLFARKEELSEKYRMVYKVNLEDGIQSSAKFPANTKLEDIEKDQQQNSNLSSCSFASLLAYLIAKKHPILSLDVKQTIITIIYTQGNDALNDALNRILFPNKTKASNLYHEYKNEGILCTIS